MPRCLIGTLLLSLGGPAWTAPPSLQDLVDPRPGQVLVYEGTASAVERSAGQTAGEATYRASLALGIVAGEAPGERRAILTRTLAPSASGITVPAISDVGLYQLETDLELVLLGEPGTDPRLRAMGAQLPAAVFPAFALPEGGAVEREESVSLQGAPPVKLLAMVKLTRDGDRASISRELAPGKLGAIELDGQPVQVTAWSEQIVCDTARKVVVEIRRHARLATTRGGAAVEIETRLDLAAKQVRGLSPEEAEAMTRLERDLDETLAAFQARKPAREIYASIRRLTGERIAALLPGLEDAMLERLSHYRQDSERAQRAAIAAEALNKEAPDFTLEDLAGNKVSFREATRGKVALLCFWYTTCPPCRKEAPYLSRLVEKYGEKGLAVIAVNARDESREAVKAFVEAQGLKQQVLLKGQAVAQAQYRVLGYPTAFWIDHQGRIVEKVTGFREEHYPEMEARVETLLAARAQGAPQGGGK